MNKIICGDCVGAMAAMPECSVDAVVTDPPYGLEFMGKEWDKLGDQRQVGRELPMRPDSPFDRQKVRYGGSAAYNVDGAEFGSRMQAWHEAWAREALRVLKPGGHLVAFGGTRTHHRLTCALEDAGFEIRDCLMWLYGQGFPKSLDVGKAVAAYKATGKSDSKQTGTGDARDRAGQHWSEFPAKKTESESKPIDPQWSGWGTALKPAWEPIVLARKPLAGAVAENVQEHGTGAVNVDGCRLHTEGSEARKYTVTRRKPGATLNRTGGNYRPEDGVEFRGSTTAGRWPANVALSHADGCELIGLKQVKTGTAVGGLHNASGTNAIYAKMDRKSDQPDHGYGEHGKETVENWRCIEGCPVRLLDKQSGVRPGSRIEKPSECETGGVTSFDAMRGSRPARGFADAGGASRFFYTAKAPGSERWSLCKTCDRVMSNQEFDDHAARFKRAKQKHEVVSHPTVKPVGLMRWLVRLVTPPGGLVLDPFVGSGTTAEAARAEGMGYVAVERDADYVRIAEVRLAGGELSFGK